MNDRVSRAPAEGVRGPAPLWAYSREVRGYHGCDSRIARRILAGEAFATSANAWDWLGDGIYFWEYGPDRAMRWAEQQARIRNPAVLGSMIQLGTCFDLLDTRFTRQLGEFYRRWITVMSREGVVPPQNRGKARFLDRAVIEAFFLDTGEAGTVYDTVRGAFVEGEPIFPGSGFFSDTHVQIAVRNPQSIIGVFRPM
ncbi:MAG: hypothetical protein JO306_00225 [Gemmatimonadetes bacterium]|nr:hypothetical protein [Gemmatimonadota bacterium]